MTVHSPTTSTPTNTSASQPSSVIGHPSSVSIGRWLGTAEVYDGHGRFLGNGTDTRHVRRLDDNHIRIDVSFVGPFKHSGHYTIAERENGRVRLYQGPANVGYAETLRDGLIDAHAYWAALGLSQRFFLMVLPDGHTQLSLALMSRGEKLLYVVVGQNNRVVDTTAENSGAETAVTPPSFLSGTSYDLADDPAAGRGHILLHRTGRWVGELTTLDGDLQPLPATHYAEMLTTNGRTLHTEITGTAFVPEPAKAVWHTNQWEAWTEAGQLVGSYSLSGGRALSGQCHFLPSHLRLWRREVANHSGTHKAVLHTWYRGGVRVGVQFGVLAFDEG